VARVAILTTDTQPHRYFCNRVRGRVFLEDEPPDRPGYGFCLAREREEFELRRWGTQGTGYESTYYGKRLNGVRAVRDIAEYRPDVILVLGTLRLCREIVAINPDGIYNFHSGDPAKYRGLDCDLWAIYHKDRPRVCLHRCTDVVDTGDKVLVREIPYTSLVDLRARKAEISVEMAKKFLSSKMESTPYEPGRYYGAMPTILQRRISGV